MQKGTNFTVSRTVSVQVGQNKYPSGRRCVEENTTHALSVKVKLSAKTLPRASVYRHSTLRLCSNDINFLSLINNTEIYVQTLRNRWSIPHLSNASLISNRRSCIKVHYSLGLVRTRPAVPWCPQWMPLLTLLTSLYQKQRNKLSVNLI